MLRALVVLCAVLLPVVASAQGPTATGAPVVFFSIFGADGAALQRFYADLFEWTVPPDGNLTAMVTSPLPAAIGKGAAEVIVYVGVDDVTATLTKAQSRGATIRYPRFEVPGRVVLGVFKDPVGNSIGLVEMESGKVKIPKAPAR